MLFCNISSDKVHICDAQGEIFLERNGIEKVLGPTLVDRAKKSPFDQVFLVNGPGGFTNLRVGALTWNLVAHLLHLRKQTVNFFSCTKIDLYRYFVKKGILPKIGYIYLGQKHSVWKYDFEKDLYEMVNQPFVFEKESFCDRVHDSAYWGENFDMTHFGNDEKGAFLLWKGEKYYFTAKDLDLKKVSSVKAEYMIDPTLG
ncbi:hypothetical protein P148_SR1C00001G0697 [candidate division SR1 bacterium RAAC1_SR1_1]|nr:hypothetical protein P148_SR1C00001G0697 [candidate division SR1 bacterium RAAC1_SR1_1]